MTDPEPYIRLSAFERFVAWILTGPVGRFVAFFVDLGVYAWRRLRGGASGDGER